MTEACASAVSNIFAQQTLKRRGISSTGLFEEVVVIIDTCPTEQTNKNDPRDDRHSTRLATLEQ